MRVALLCSDRGVALGGLRGAAVQMRSLAGALLRRGHGVSAIVAETGDPAGCDELTDLGLELRALREPRGGRREERMREIDWHLARLAPDLVIERLTLFSPEGAELAAAAGIPHLYSIGTALEDDLLHAAGVPDVSGAREAMGIGFAASRGSLVPTDETAAWVRRVAPATHRVLVHGGGASPAFFATPETESVERVRCRLRLRSGEFRLGHVGTLCEGRDLGSLVDAVARVSRQIPTRLVLIGDGPMRNALLERATACKVPVTLAGHVPHADIPAALSLLDAVAQPADPVRPSGSGLALFEAMAAARAIVATAGGVASRVLRDGTNARLARPGDVEGFGNALLEVAADPALRGRLGAEARRSAELHHTWDGAGERLVTFASGLDARSPSACRN